MELPIPSLQETLRRLGEVVEERGLDRSEVLDPRRLAARTALSEQVVRALLRGDTPAPDEVEERVCQRVRTLAAARVSQGMGKTRLVNEVAERLGISTVWARLLLDGRKVPTVPFLHKLAQYFEVDGEAFFTTESSTALNRALLPELEKHETPRRDPIEVLLEKHGVVAADFRRHGALPMAQLETMIDGLIRSVLPKEGGSGR